MALTIATGFVVDDAIVMIENIARYVEQGDTPLQAALKGSAQIGFTIISLTVSLMAVLIPLLFMGEVVGRLFHEFAITLAVTIVISAVVSLTLVPMLCAKLLRPPRRSPRAPFERGTGAQCSTALIARYGRALRWVLDRQPLDACWWRWHAGADRGALRGHSQGLLSRSGHRPDPGDLRGAADVSYDAMAEHQQALAAGHPRGPGRRQPVLVHRRRRHQYDAEQRPVPDQPQAARSAHIAGSTAIIQRLQQRRPSRHHAVHAAGAGSDEINWTHGRPDDAQFNL